MAEGADANAFSTNLAIARSANDVRMDREIGTNQGDRYSIITLVFFIPYIIFEIPSQFGLRKFGAKLWLGSAVVLWGVSVPQRRIRRRAADL